MLNSKNQLVNITINLVNGEVLRFQEVTANLIPSGIYIEKPLENKPTLLASVNEYSVGRFINLNSIEQFEIVPVSP